MTAKKINTNNIQKIKNIRKDLGLTQLEMAQMCEVHLRTWTNWEHGRTAVPTPIVKFLDAELARKKQPRRLKNG